MAKWYGQSYLSPDNSSMMRLTRDHQPGDNVMIDDDHVEVPPPFHCDHEVVVEGGHRSISGFRPGCKRCGQKMTPVKWEVDDSKD